MLLLLNYRGRTWVANLQGQPSILHLHHQFCTLTHCSWDATHMYQCKHFVKEMCFPRNGWIFATAQWLMAAEHWLLLNKTATPPVGISDTQAMQFSNTLGNTGQGHICHTKQHNNPLTHIMVAPRLDAEGHHQVESLPSTPLISSPEGHDDAIADVPSGIVTRLYAGTVGLILKWCWYETAQWQEPMSPLVLNLEKR